MPGYFCLRLEKSVFLENWICFGVSLGKFDVFRLACAKAEGTGPSKMMPENVLGVESEMQSNLTAKCSVLRKPFPKV